MTTLKMYTNGPRTVVSKTRAVTRSMLVATPLFKLPWGARILGFVLSGIASTAGTSATLSVGSTTTATEYVNAQDVKTAATGAGVLLLNGVPGAVTQVALSADTVVYVKYFESGTASGAGSWYLTCLFTTGEVFNR